MIGIFKLSLWLNYKEDYSWRWIKTNPDLFPQINMLCTFYSRSRKKLLIFQTNLCDLVTRRKSHITF